MLQLRAISKNYGAFTALDALDFSVESGEIVALLGENGAGKSTTIALIGGEIRPSTGEISWQNEIAQFSSPREAARAGIGVVHQHFSLVPALSVAENLALACGVGARFVAREWEERAREWAKNLSWHIEPRALVSEISVGETQRVEILKALFGFGKTRLLLLDEPTANLTPDEARELFATLRKLRAQGLGIVFVSHKLPEVVALCDRVCVLRRGKKVGETRVENTSVEELARLMIGEAGLTPPPASGNPANRCDEKRLEESVSPAFLPALEIKNLHCAPLKNLNLTLFPGQITGIAGVDGNGQRELFEVLAGLRPMKSGQIAGGKVMAFVPPDRQSEGLILEFDLAQNLAISESFRRDATSRGVLNWLALRQKSREILQKYDVRTPRSENAPERARAGSLSGGNAQKIVLARALESGAKVLVAVDPTRGLDIGATTFTRQKMREFADGGGAVLLLSSDLDEILGLSDQIGALYAGEVLPRAALLPRGATREKIGQLMGGLDEN